ncbi:MAG: hypothetical protein ACKOWF_15095 [Chloroflexota bacterium]
MESSSFDRWTRWLGAATTRRTGLGAALAAALGLSAAGVEAEGEDGQGEVSTEKCIPNGRRCGTRKKNGKKRGKPCSKCCSGKSTSGRKSRCTCRPDGTECRGDSQCCNGLCKKQVCVNPNIATECSTAADCPGTGNTCSKGVCKCGSGGACPNICSNGVCLECTTDDQCRGGQFCVANVCGNWVNTAFVPGQSFPDKTGDMYPRGVWLSADALTMAVGDDSYARVSIWTRPSTSSRAWTPQSFVPDGSGPTGNPSPACAVGNLSEARGVALSPDALTLYALDQGCAVTVWTRPSVTSTVWTEQSRFSSGANPDSYFGSGAYNIWVSSDGLRVYLNDNDLDIILVWSRTSVTSTTWTWQYNVGTKDVNTPTDSTLYEPDTPWLVQNETVMFITERSNNRVSVWTRPDTTSTAWTLQSTIAGLTSGSTPNKLNNPRGVWATEDGLRAFIVDRDNYRVVIWSRPSLTSTTWSVDTILGSGTEGSGAGEFDWSRQIYSPDDGLTLYIADGENSRITIWEA